MGKPESRPLCWNCGSRREVDPDTELCPDCELEINGTPKIDQEDENEDNDD